MREVFGLNTDLKVPAFSQRDEHVPDIDPGNLRGRMRTYPASRAASAALNPSAIRSRAKDTIRMLFAVATPIAMIAPMSEGTFSVVWVAQSIHRIPARTSSARFIAN